MKTEEEIKEILKSLQKELGEIEEQNIFAKGFIQGQIDFAFCILENANDKK